VSFLPRDDIDPIESVRTSRCINIACDREINTWSNVWDKSDQIFSLQRHFLHWFEALALLKIRDGIRAVTLLESMFERPF
jgi:hypothetical protein